MKAKLFLLLALLGISLNAATLRTNVTLIWNYPAGELSTNLTFKIYSFTNLSQPKIQWQVFTNVVGTNVSVVVPVQAVATYFTMTASNLVGEGDFSNADQQPAPPRIGTLQIQ